jgi:hypothetical protein
MFPHEDGLSLPTMYCAVRQKLIQLKGARPYTAVGAALLDARGYFRSFLRGNPCTWLACAEIEPETDYVCPAADMSAPLR